MLIKGYLFSLLSFEAFFQAALQAYFSDIVYTYKMQ